jgi:Innexin.
MFFNSKDKHRKRTNQVRLLGNYLVKFLYLLNGIVSIAVIDHLTHKRFRNYGSEYITYTRISTFTEDESTEANPVNKFLPVFGICDIMDVRYDLTNVRANKVRVVCENTLQILYQYMFVLFWFLLVFSIACSICGLALYIGTHLYLLMNRLGKGRSGYVYYQHLTLRQCEYIACIRRRNLSMFLTIQKTLNERYLHEAWRDQSAASLQKFHPVPME